VKDFLILFLRTSAKHTQNNILYLRIALVFFEQSSNH